MSHSLYREFLTEEEKFLKQLERNFQDQINRLKVEELSLLKLISSSDINTESTSRVNITDNTPLFQITSKDDENEESDDEELPLAELSKKLTSPKKKAEINELSVNKIPLNFNIASSSNDSAVAKMEVNESKEVDEEVEEGDDDEEEDSEEVEEEEDSEEEEEDRKKEDEESVETRESVNLNVENVDEDIGDG